MPRRLPTQPPVATIEIGTVNLQQNQRKNAHHHAKTSKGKKERAAIPAFHSEAKSKIPNATPPSRYLPPTVETVCRIQLPHPENNSLEHTNREQNQTNRKRRSRDRHGSMNFRTRPTRYRILGSVSSGTKCRLPAKKMAAKSMAKYRINSQARTSPQLPRHIQLTG